MVDAVDEHRRVVLARGRQNDLLRTRVQVFLRRHLVQKQTGRLDHHVGADLAPIQLGRVALLRQTDLLAVDHQLPAFDRQFALEAAVYAVVLEHIGQVVGL